MLRELAHARQPDSEPTWALGLDSGAVRGGFPWDVPLGPWETSLDASQTSQGGPHSRGPLGRLSCGSQPPVLPQQLPLSWDANLAPSHWLPGYLVPDLDESVPTEDTASQPVHGAVLLTCLPPFTQPQQCFGRGF